MNGENEMTSDQRLDKELDQWSQIKQNYIDDIRRMLEFCRDEGKAIPDSLGKDVASILDGKSDYELILSAHGKLSGIVAPATPRSLAATEFSLRNNRAYRTYFLVGFLLLMALVGLVGYILTLPRPVSPASQSPTSAVIEEKMIDRVSFVSRTLDPDAANAAVSVSASNSSQDSLRTQVNYLFAAMMGAAFSGLLTVYDYLKNRCFNPDYMIVYFIRFFLGLLAGMVVGNVGSNLIQGNQTISELGPGIIALLGGYSAEAVRQILDRLVEVLVTAVKGKDTRTDERLVVAQDVLSIAQVAAADSNTPDEVRDKLNDLLKKLQQ